MGFLVICVGITILQMSKVDPEKLTSSTAVRRCYYRPQEPRPKHGREGRYRLRRPGHGYVARFVRHDWKYHPCTDRQADEPEQPSHIQPTNAPLGRCRSLRRHCFMDEHGRHAPASRRHEAASVVRRACPPGRRLVLPRALVHSDAVAKRPTIKFDSQDMVHQYSRPGQPQSPATHEHRQAVHGSMLLHAGYPPLPALPDTRDSVVSEGNLIDTTPILPPPPPGPMTPTPSMRGATLDQQQQQQTLVMPRGIAAEHAVHSAPATMYQRVGGQQHPLPAHKDSRELFDRSTLLSFPSVTDSSPSDWNDEELERLQMYASAGGPPSTRNSSASLAVTPKAKAAERQRSRERTRTPKRYPKGLDDDDEEEESQRLVRKGTLSTEETDTELPPDMGSIRLVSSQPKSHF